MLELILAHVAHCVRDTRLLYLLYCLENLVHSRVQAVNAEVDVHVQLLTWVCGIQQVCFSAAESVQFLFDYRSTGYG